MTVIIGCGEYGIWIRRQILGDEQDVVFYDNDRRKWGEIISKTRVVSLDEFISLIKREETKLVIGGKNPSILQFVKDIYPMCSVLKVEDDKLIRLKTESIGDFQYDNAFQIGEENLKRHIDKMNLKYMERVKHINMLCSILNLKRNIWIYQRFLQ